MALNMKRILLGLFTAVFAFLALVTWALASPVGAAPDDDYHLASIWCSLGERDGLCSPGASETERIVSERLVKSSSCFAQAPEQSAQCSLDDSRMISTDRGNFAGSYPPVFYTVMGIFAGTDVAVSTVIMRLLNSAIFVVAVAATIALLKPGQRGPIIWCCLVGLVPLGMFIIPSVNPSTWAILAGMLLLSTIVGYFTAGTAKSRVALGVISFVLAIMGAGARGDSAVYVAFAAVVAMILTFKKNRTWFRRAILPFGIIVIGAFFFLVAGQATGAAVATVASGQQTANSLLNSETSDNSTFGLIFSNLFDLPWLWTGGTGTWGLGWFDTPLVKSVWVLMIGMLFALLIWGIQVTSNRKGVVLLLTLLSLIAIPLYVLHGEGARVGALVQPRYLLPLVLIFTVVALYGFTQDHLGLSRLQAGVVFTAVALSNSLSLRNNMRRYITGTDVGGFNLDVNIEWWWDIGVSPMFVWFAGSIAFSFMLLGFWFWLYVDGERPGLSAKVKSSLVSKK